MKRISLVEDTIDCKDIVSLMSWLRSNPRLTKGGVTEEFEKRFARYIGKKHAVFVNSGSSAILLMLAALRDSGGIPEGCKIVIPAVCWATDASSVINLGFEPVLCDCNLMNFGVDVGHLEDIFEKENPHVLLLVSVLGFPPHMGEIESLCKKYGVILLEDVCESLGSEYGGYKLGSFGYASVFSTYYGHHISTIEGGLICTDDTFYYNVLKSMRSHGWDRDVDSIEQRALRENAKVDDFQAKFTFHYSGYNFRPTDLQAQIGLNQINKLNDIVEKRVQVHKWYVDRLDRNKLFRTSDKISLFAQPILTNDRENMIQALDENNIECRPLICGNIALQPFMKKYSTNYCYNANTVHHHGLYVPAHPKLTEEDVDRICNVVLGVS